MSKATEQQPSPVGGGKPVWAMVMADLPRIGLSDADKAALLADMEARDAFGRARYGTPLCLGDGRDTAVDVYQELLDAAVYARKQVEEHGGLKAADGTLVGDYYKLLGLCARAAKRTRGSAG